MADALRNWEHIRADPAIQFDQVQMPKQAPPPDWLTRFLRWLVEHLKPIGQELSAVWPTLKWILLAIAIVAAAWLLWRLIEPVARIRIRRGKAAADGHTGDDWAPDRMQALALLDDADRLASEGRYDEATHLLLQRSVGQIAQARPGTLEPSSTAREIARNPALPERARSAFAVIAERVERSLFALRRLEAADWQAARAAYADFALADLTAREIAAGARA